MPRRREGELRCFCRNRPLLGMFGRDRHGALYVHVKVFKGGRIFGEMIFTEGKVRIRCRECLRWYTVKIQSPNSRTVDFDLEDLPASMPVGQEIS